MPLKASLPQYDMPEIRDATDSWWQGIASHLKKPGLPEVPDTLLRTEDDEAVWRQDGVILTQTCGYPLITELTEFLRPLAAPVYDCAGCRAGTYASALVVREESAGNHLTDYRGQTVAINNANSHSGMNALRHSVAPFAREGRFFKTVLMTGGHALSIEAVQSGKADIAAIDAVTLALLQDHRPEILYGTRIIGWTEYAPSLPYATSCSTPTEMDPLLCQALQNAVQDASLASVRKVLRISGFQTCTLKTYHRMYDMEQEAVSKGYPVIQQERV